MGKLKSALEDWLEDVGYSLGYDMSNYPNIDQWENIKIKQIYRREYGRKKTNDETKKHSK